jgi:hypothetical protein
MRAEGSARTVPVAEAGFPWRLAWTGASAFAALVVVLLLGAPAVFLAGCVAAGFGITYLCGIALSFEERIGFGAVLGAMAVSIVSFIASLVVRDVTLFTVLAGLALPLGLGLWAAIANRSRVSADAAHAAARWSAPVRSAGHPWPLAAVAVVCGAWTVHFLHQAYVYRPDGLYAGYVNIWGDWAAHLSFAGSFAYGHNFPPQYPVDPGNNLGYPFMADFFAANLVPLGSPLTSALVLTSGLLGLAFPAVLYLAALRFVGGRAAAAIAVCVFLLGGGLGFTYLLGDIQQFGIGALLHLPREYTLNRDHNYQWLNPVLAYLVPQRSTLFGFSLALIVLVLIWAAVRDRMGWRPFLFAGVVAGLMPAFHVHAFGTVVALAAFWAVFNWRSEWVVFFAPAVLLGVPVLLWMWPPAIQGFCSDQVMVGRFCIQPGWLSYADWHSRGLIYFPTEFVSFWIKNLSMFVPLLIAAHILHRWIPTGFGKWFAPMWLWFLVPNVVILQPWDWDNTKFFMFWALLGSILVGGLLAAMFKRGPGLAALAAACLVVLGLSGAADLARASDFSVSGIEFVDTRGVQLADWVRQNTSPEAVFAVADHHDNPIPTLAGRRVMVGYPGWLWTYGLGDFTQKGFDEALILRGDPTTPALVRKYGVDYVVIGPQEISAGASRSYWEQHGNLVYNNGEYAVYRVTGQ